MISWRVAPSANISKTPITHISCGSNACRFASASHAGCIISTQVRSTQSSTMTWKPPTSCWMISGYLAESIAIVIMIIIIRCCLELTFLLSACVTCSVTVAFPRPITYSSILNCLKFLLFYRELCYTWLLKKLEINLKTFSLCVYIVS